MTCKEKGEKWARLLNITWMKISTNLEKNMVFAQPELQDFMMNFPHKLCKDCHKYLKIYIV